ncbi:hypothetical protein NPIL_308561 [Nephila pilipes]|uniref:Uncharacterized protein n=1 Tax=Nephila pilipes TaxID=299642 RepID=A0A8X6PCL8_NEPPI|nr:hypothetical protein NPIL_308561 [Nephila pilipes]
MRLCADKMRPSFSEENIREIQLIAVLHTDEYLYGIVEQFKSDLTHREDSVTDVDEIKNFHLRKMNVMYPPIKHEEEHEPNFDFYQ